jgi:hypothetical protein
MTAFILTGKVTLSDLCTIDGGLRLVKRYTETTFDLLVLYVRLFDSADSYCYLCATRVFVSARQKTRRSR